MYVCVLRLHIESFAQVTTNNLNQINLEKNYRIGALQCSWDSGYHGHVNGHKLPPSHASVTRATSKLKT